LDGLLARDSATFSMEVDVELSEQVVASVNRQIKEMKQVRRDDDESTEGLRTNGSKAKSPRPLAIVRETNLRYRIEIEIRPKSGILRVADEYLAALNERGEPTGKRSPFLSRERDRLHLRMEGQAHPTHFERYLDHSMLSKSLYPPHYPHITAMQQELANWYFFYFEPRERMRAASPAREVRHIGLMGEELASYLNTLKVLNETQFRAVEKALQLIIPAVTGIEVGVNNLGEVDLKLREGERLIPARVLSEGTLRVLGLLALTGAKDPPALLGFEEPENGIHPRRIQLIAKLLKSRANARNTQLIVTTHSPTLLDLIDNKSLFLCRKDDGETTIERLDESPLFKSGRVAEGLDAEDGIASVSDLVLRGDFDA
jgi:predicted ATPase